MTQTTASVDIEILLSEGNAALLVSDTYTARQRFRSVIELDAANVEALLGLAKTALPYREKRDYLIRALALAPDNAAVRSALTSVEARLAAGELIAPRSATPTDAPENPIQVGQAPPPAGIELLTCYNHPDRETGLRCTNCNRPICAACVRPAPVGQLCPECARARRPTNYQVGWLMIVGVSLLSVLVGGVLSFLVIQFLAPLPFISFIVAFFVAPLVGEGYGRLLDRITRTKRGREIQLAVGIGIGVGLAPLGLLLLFAGLIYPTFLLLLVVGGLLIRAVTRRLI